MSILPLLLSLAVCTATCDAIFSREELSNMLATLAGRVQQLEENENLAEVVGKLGDKLDKMGDKLLEGLEKLGEKLAGSNGDDKTPTTSCDANQTLSCVDVRRTDKTDGVHTLTVNNTQINVFCDQQTEGGGWTVIQRRQDGSVDFNRTWEEYRKGFGDLDGEFWLGLDNMHLLSKSQKQTLRVELEAFDGSTVYAEYSFFFVDGPASFYLLSVEGYSGTAGDAMRHNNVCPFNTYDNDHNPRLCSVDRDAGWWADGCSNCNLNGPYYTSAQPGIIDSVNWWDWRHKYFSLKHVEMKIRPAI